MGWTFSVNGLQYGAGFSCVYSIHKLLAFVMSRTVSHYVKVVSVNFSGFSPKYVSHHGVFIMGSTMLVEGRRRYWD